METLRETLKTLGWFLEKYGVEISQNIVLIKKYDPYISVALSYIHFVLDLLKSFAGIFCYYMEFQIESAKPNKKREDSTEKYKLPCKHQRGDRLLRLFLGLLGRVFGLVAFIGALALITGLACPAATLGSPLLTLETSIPALD